MILKYTPMHHLILAAALSKFIIGAFALSLSPVLPDIGHTLHVSSGLLGFAGGSYAFATAIIASLGSAIQNKYPRRLLIYTGICVHFAGILMVSLSPTFFFLLIGKVVCGAGAGILLPAIVAHLSDKTPYNQRAAFLGKTNIGWAASTILGVPLTSFISNWLGWRTGQLFLASLWPIAIISLIRTLDKVPSSIVSSSMTADGLGSKRNVSGQWPMFVCTLGLFIGFYGTYSFLGTAIRSSHGSSASLTGLLIMCYGCGFFNASCFAKQIETIGKEKVLFFSLLLQAIILVILPYSIQYDLWLISPILFFWGNTQNLAFTSSISIVSGTHESIRGQALAINQSALSYGFALGTIMMGYVIESHGFAMVGLICAISTILSAVIIFFFVLDPKTGNKINLK